MTQITKPMLAGKCTDPSKLIYPVLATPKLDGIRCLVIGGKAVSRAFKPIPNDYIRGMIESTVNSMQLDGEIMIPDREFNDLSGDVRRKEGRHTNFYYAVFDYVDARMGWHRYKDRMLALGALMLPAFCKKILPVEILDEQMLALYEQKQLALGYEGVMIRAVDGPYKCGRSSEKEGYLLKLKQFADDEAVIVSSEEEMENQNVAERDAFGRTKRASNQENLVPKGTLGKLICENKKLWPESFGIGTGFTADMRKVFWEERNRLVGLTVKFKHQPPPVGGEKLDRPRIPVFLGFREKWDM